MPDKLSVHLDRYEREIVPKMAPRTQKDYRRHLAVLRKHFGHMDPNEVLPRDVGKFLDTPTGKIQANRRVAVLSGVYTKMVSRWYVAERNPCLGVERNPAKRRTRYVTDTEFCRMRSFCSPRLQLAMDLALLTAQRQGDLLALPWGNVTDEGILFRQSKSGKRLLIATSPSLQAVLARAATMAPARTPDSHVIQTRKGLPYSSEGFRAMWQRTMVRAQKRGFLEERFTFHDLRAKSISDTASIHDAYDRAGHTSLAMTRGTYDRGIRKVTSLK